ncbi:hypothetical protein Patl1_18605 [Pistacia atlantica]|uniref:Uncharacterized protein n=1 Tax=Pistacia atlantica TaxID=434234 RepID=A0ACC1C341_9ROSI|nr:hypothetical protein Patl1_18605 [Pistacia atlantica]
MCTCAFRLGFRKVIRSLFISFASATNTESPTKSAPTHLCTYRTREMEEEMEVELPVFEAREIDLDYEFDAARFFDFTLEESLPEAREAELWFESAPSYPPSPFVAKLVLREDILLKNVNTSPKSIVNTSLDNDSDNGVVPEFSAIGISVRASLSISQLFSIAMLAMPKSLSITIGKELESDMTLLLPFIDCAGMSKGIFTNLQSGNLQKVPYQPLDLTKGLKFYDHMSTDKVKTKAKPAKTFTPRISTLMKPTTSQLAKQNKAAQVGNSR